MEEPPVVHLSPSASLKGKVTYLEGSVKPVYAYLGVPFAEPPVGELRLKKPRPKALWDGERDATECGAAPWQELVSYGVFMDGLGFKAPGPVSEDCLYLNIYTPTRGATGNLPVMVWFYGGGFKSGSSHYYMGTAYAALGDVVHVAINYRVGVLGFFSTGDKTCPGNFGLWDQVEGLKWVQEHIRQFGGDPSNVTIFGESAGGNSVSFHHVTSASRGLFHKSIHISGVATGGPMGELLTKDMCQANCTAAAEALGLPEGSSPGDVYSAIKEMPAEDLIKYLEPLPIMPALDGELFMQNAHTAYRTGHINKANSLFIICTHEGNLIYDLMFAPMNLPLSTKPDFTTLATILASGLKNYPITDVEGFAAALSEEYFPGEEQGEDAVLEAFVEALGDMMFFSHMDTFLKLHAGAVPEGTYHGVYGYRHSRSQHRAFVKADHGNDTPIEYGLPLMTAHDRTNKEWSQADKDMSKTMITYYSNFAKTGNPNGPSVAEWSCFTSDRPQYLKLEEECCLVTGAYKPHRARFWAMATKTF